MNTSHIKLFYNVLVFAVLFMVTNKISAQQTIAQNFTITDHFNNNLNLFNDLLDQGKTVVLDIFFTTCPPCNSIAPDLKTLYEDWGDGDHDVEFIGLSNQAFDSNADVAWYANNHQHTYPGAGEDGGSLLAVAPYVNGDYGTFFGTPTFVVIAPDRTVNFNVRGPGNAGTILALDAAIAATGAMKPTAPSFSGVGKIEVGNDPVDSIMVQLSVYQHPNSVIPFVSQLPLHYEETMTNNIGFYQFNVTNLPGNNIEIKPVKTDSVEYFISTVDIIYIRRHLLNKDTLPPDIVQFCADIDGNGVPSTIDITHLRRVLLDKADNFPNNDPWRFNPPSMIISDPTNGGPFNFKIYKTGDASGDFNEY